MPRHVVRDEVQDRPEGRADEAGADGGEQHDDTAQRGVGAALEGGRCVHHADDGQGDIDQHQDEADLAEHQRTVAGAGGSGEVRSGHSFPFGVELCTLHGPKLTG